MNPQGRAIKHHRVKAPLRGVLLQLCEQREGMDQHGGKKIGESLLDPLSMQAERSIDVNQNLVSKTHTESMVFGSIGEISIVFLPQLRVATQGRYPVSLTPTPHTPLTTPSRSRVQGPTYSWSLWNGYGLGTQLPPAVVSSLPKRENFRHWTQLGGVKKSQGHANMK